MHDLAQPHFSAVDILQLHLKEIGVRFVKYTRILSTEM